MHVGDFNRKFKVHLGGIEMIGKVLTLSLFFPRNYDLLLGPLNGVSRRIQRLVEKELEAVKLCSFLKLINFES